MESNFIYIDENTFVGSNGVYGVGYKIDLLQKYSLGEQDFADIHQMWTKAFSLLENAVIVKSDFYLPSNFDTSNFEDLNFLQKSTKEHFKDREYLMHNSYIFFLKPNFDTYLNTGWYNPFKSVNKRVFNEIEEEQKAFYTEVKNAVNFIHEKKFSGNERMKLTPLNQEELISFENMYFSGLAQGFTTNVFTQDKEVYTGDKKIGVITVDNEANFQNFLKDCIVDQDYTDSKYKYYKNYADSFSFNLNFAHIYNQVFFIDSAKRAVSELEKVYEALHKNRSWNRANEISAEQIKEVLDSLIKSEDRRIIRGSTSVIIFEEDQKAFERQKEEVVSMFNNMDITPHYLSSSNRIKSEYFLNFPVFAPYLNDKQLFKLPLDCACCLVSNTTHYKNDEEGILFTSRVQNIPVVVDNYFEDKKYENARNSIIIASTGHGKSTLINHLITKYYYKKEKVVIIDYGGSYKKFSEFFNNDVAYITYEDKKPLGFNIFDLGLINGEYVELSSDSIKKISEYILIHTGVEHTKEEVEIIKKIVKNYYDNELDKPTFHKFYDYLEFNKIEIFKLLEIDEKYFDINRFLLLIEAFSAKGGYSHIYEDTGERIQDKANKLITIFELENASQDHTILTLLLYLSDVIIDKEILADTSIRGHIIFDEIAKMYSFDGVIEKVELHYQTVRKKEAEITQVLQTIHQLPDTKTGKAIIENTQVLYVLHAKDYEPIKKAFNLSNHALYQMQSLQGKLKEGEIKYSEIFIMRGNHHAVYRLELPPEVFWQYQTDGVTNALLMKELEKTGNLEQAIKNMVNLSDQEVKNQIKTLNK